MNELFGYDLFNNVPEPLRSFNRTVVVGNLVNAGRKEHAREYLEQFNDKERTAIMATQLLINRDGMDSVKKAVVAKIDWELVD